MLVNPKTKPLDMKMPPAKFGTASSSHRWNYAPSKHTSGPNTLEWIKPVNCPSQAQKGRLG